MASVLISGAGPIGLTMANELARYGIPVRIVDKAAQRTDKSKALVLWSRTLELLDHGGYVEPFLKAGMQGHGAQISDGKNIVARVRLDGIDTPYPYALMIAQSETERVLEECLAKRGVKVERSVTMESFAEKGAGIEAVLRKADGTSETVQADWLLGCDGAHSTTRHGLGLAFEGSTHGQRLVSGRHPRHRARAAGSSAHLLASRRHPGLLPDHAGPLARHRRPRAGRPAAATMPIRRWRRSRPWSPHRGTPGIKVSNPIWLPAFRINERKVKDYSRGRIFLSGDAAHIHSPAGGQGMNTGMQDAFNLSWKLNLVMNGIAKPSLLDSYSIERSAVGDMVLRNAGRMTEAAIARNPLVQALRNTIVKFALGFPQIAHVMADTLSELDIAYPESPLIGRRRAARAWRQARARAGPSRCPPTPASRASPPSARPTSRPTSRPSSPSSSQAAASSKHADPRDLVLVRPDGYVGFAGAASDRAGRRRPICRRSRPRPSDVQSGFAVT